MYTLLTVLTVNLSNRMRKISFYYAQRAFPSHLFLLALDLLVCLFVFRFGIFTVRLLAHFSPLILRIELWQTNYWIMWQMCERLRLNKYFKRSEWWSINHRDKLGAILQAPSRHCACVRNETNEPFLLNNLSLTLTLSRPFARPPFGLLSHHKQSATII